MLNTLCADIMNGVSLDIIKERHAALVASIGWGPRSFNCALSFRTKEEALVLGQWGYSCCKTATARHSLLDLVEYAHRPYFPTLELMDHIVRRLHTLRLVPGLGTVLEKATQRNYYTPAICQRLLDGGADIDLLHFKVTDSQRQVIVREWWSTRQACRKGCVLVLGLHKRLSPSLARCLPRDILKMVAQHRWRMRFHVPAMRERTRPKRKNK